MAIFKSILLAISAATLAASSPVGNYNINDKTTHVARAGPILYSGPWQSFPGADTWLSYDALVRYPYIAPSSSIASPLPNPKPKGEKFLT